MSLLMKQKNSEDDHFPPSWEILHLVSQYLDPKSLAIATCVNKTWLILMSSDLIWKPICLTHYPSLSILNLTHPTISYRHLYTLGHFSSMSRRIRPLAPTITMNDLYFTFDVFDGNTHICSITKYGGDLRHDVNSLFRFDFYVGSDFTIFGMCDELRVRWNVVLKEWKGVCMVMDCKGKGTSVSSGSEQWFSEELPSTGCCLESGPTGIVAELGFRLCNEGSDCKMMKIEKVSMSFFSVICCRYLGIDDALRYLQRFLLPSHHV
ncbi:hypothetical protein AQUCO_00100058v1 [Aquilegia coerulea]|uniref:F-box protein n=1 Tax=Aquilegia coerulea TaxID=218851 RepID=A0A2G5F8J0_AQUCA|nr:hypothetical protein AQUCO_00100058v1 [Aquilegia coerulea]